MRHGSGDRGVGSGPERRASLRDAALRAESLERFGIIDFHVHLGTWALSYLPVRAGDMLEAARHVGIRRLCINGIFGPCIREANDEVAAFAARHADLVVPFAVLNPYQGSMTEELVRCIREHRCRGLKVHDFHQGMHSPSIREAFPEWDEVWEMCARAGLPVLFHGVVTDEDVRRHRDTVFVMAHGIGNPERVRRLADRPNLYADTSWSQASPRSLLDLVRLVGPDRIVWGSDAPLADFAQRLAIVLDSGLDELTQLKIVAGNARRILRLEGRD